jgi:Zn-dependent protease with chaperone function
VFVPLALAALLLSQASGAARFPPTSDEVKLGAQAAKDLESRYRLVTDPAMVDRITRIGETLSRVVERQDLTYHFRILDVPVVNALSLPGGWVYVTRGMMRFVRTDHELAAVIAHELTHINHRHYYIQEERASHMTPALILAAAISVLAHSAAPILGVQLAAQGAMSDYQRDLEREADLTGITYLTKTPYSPVAMLTLMEHLAQLERLSGQPDDLGIYQDHPKASERVAYIRDDLVHMKIPIVRRTAEGYLKISLDPASPAGDQPVTIRVDNEPVLTIGAGGNGQTPADRATGIVARLNTFFNRDPAPFDPRVAAIQDRWSVVGGETVLFDVSPQDAAFARMTPEALAQDFKIRLSRVIAAAPYNRKF